MFTSPTTIILGAGASFEFGAPLGPGLWTRVARETDKLQRAWESYLQTRPAVNSIEQVINDHSKDSPKTAAYFAEIAALLEDHAAIDAIMQSKDRGSRFANNPHAIMKTVAKRVADANVHSSVDDFLRDNASLLPVLRVLITAELFESFYEEDKKRTSQWKLRRLAFTERFALPHQNKEHAMVDNWLQRLVGACRPLLIRAGKRITPVTVISFNYDRLMETVLSHYWQKAERKFPPLHECFEFIYPYGCFSEFPDTVTRPIAWLREQSHGIGVANGEESPKAEAARAAISRAQQIFSIGFSFTDTNMALLGLRSEHGPKLFVQNYGDKDTRLRRVLERFPGAKSDPAPLAQLVSDGFFEQQGTSLQLRTAKTTS